jgi:hypothetical protein
LEADWQRFYGRDLRADTYGPEPLGFRRIAALVKGLPPEAMYWRQVEGWDTRLELQAVTAEVLHGLYLAFLRANSKHPPKAKPLKVPRPYDTRAPEPKAVPMSEWVKMNAGAASNIVAFPKREGA